MESNKILLLFQLINKMEEGFNSLKKAYESLDKERFDKSKKLLLDIQKKIEVIIT